MNLDALAPQDQIPYFLAPVLSTATPPAPGGQYKLCDYDPMRILLVVSGLNLPSSIQIGPAANAGVATGWYTLTPTSPNLVITQRDWGSLVNAAWFADPSLGNNFSVLSLSLKEWPNANKARQRKPLA